MTSGKGAFGAWLTSPWLALLAIGLGFAAGEGWPDFGHSLAPIGAIFIGLLRMCIIPIMVTAIISSLGRLVRNPDERALLPRLVLVVVAGLLLASLIGGLTGLMLRPGANISDSAKADMGRLLFKSDQGLALDEPAGQVEAASFFVDMVPVNIFASLAEGHGLQILIFSIFIGLALGTVKMHAASVAIDLAAAGCEGFKRIIGWLLYALPLGLFAIFAELAAGSGVSLFKVLLPLIVAVLTASIALFLVHVLVISWRARVAPWRAVLGLKKSLLIALGTANSFVALAMAMIELEENLGGNRQTANLVMPLGIVLNRQGVVLVFAVTVCFVAQLYGVSLGAQGLVVAVVGSAIAGAAALGRMGVAAGLLGFVLAPLGIPPETAVIVLLSLEVVLDPITGALIVLANCASTLLIQKGA